jgi:hypothetical protein
LAAGLACLATGHKARAAAASKEIRITLFGQPCLLQGPLDEKALRTVHSLSPDQLYPARENTLAAGPTRRALEKLRGTTGAPAGLDRYRERLAKRLEAQLLLLTAIETSRADGKAASLLAASKAKLSGKRQKEFDAAAKKAETAKTLTKAETLDALFDSFSDGIEPDPEEEFHRSIQRMGVQYACSFENTGEDTDTESGAEAEAKPSS